MGARRSGAFRHCPSGGRELPWRYQPDLPGGSATCGWNWVARWGRDRGVATAALNVITDWGFETLGIESITLATMLGNVASERVAQKAGYALVGERSDYKPPRNPESVYSVKEWERRHTSGSA